MNKTAKIPAVCTAWLTVMALLLSMTTLPVFGAVFGDVTGDGQCDMMDALALYNAVAGQEKTIGTNLGDIDGNGDVNILDALALYSHAGDGTPLPSTSTSTITPISHANRYGRQLLVSAGNTAMVNAYDYLHQQVNKYATTISLYSYGLTVPQAQRVIRYYRDDHPEVFWMSLEYSYRYSGSTMYDVTFTYDFTTAQIEAYKTKLATATKDMLSGITASTSLAERARMIHNRLVLRAQYDQTFAKANSHNLLGVLIDKTGVCESYSLAYEYLLHQCGIQAGLVVGESHGVGHMWNIVQLGGNWYQTDVTWDDPVINSTHDWSNYYTYNYLNTTTAHILTDHTIQREYSSKDTSYAVTYPIPSCTATAENHQLKTATAVSCYNASAMAPVLAEAIKNDAPAIFRTTGGYSAASLEAALRNDMSAMIDRINSYLSSSERVTSVKYITQVNPTHNTFEILFG